MTLGPGTFEQVEEAAQSLRLRWGTLPETAIVLGSGLGDFADNLLDAMVTPYGEVPHWPASQVVGHAGTRHASTPRGGH